MLLCKLAFCIWKQTFNHFVLPVLKSNLKSHEAVWELYKAPGEDKEENNIILGQM